MGSSLELDLVDLIEALDAGTISHEQLMTETLDRIEAINPKVNAIVSLRPREELISEATACDRTARKKPLHGIPLAIKDLVDTKELRTTYGSQLFADHHPVADSLLAERIRASGAIIIGKTNVPEFGLGSQTYNSVHGATRNPYDLTKTSGGSSGGAAAAIAAKLVSVADGSDMMGSLRNPAAFCNVYGFRPTYGLVPGDPTGETFLHQLSTNGPMSRSVADLALLLDVISGPEPGYPHSLPEQPSFLRKLQEPKDECRIAWLGDWDGYFPMERGILHLCESALSTLGQLGHHIDRIAPEFDPEKLWMSWTRLRSLANLESLGKHYENPEERNLLKPEVVYEVEQGLSLQVEEILEASLIRSEWFAYTASLFEAWDAIVFPSAQVFPFDVNEHWPSAINETEMTTYHKWMEIVVPASLIGLPALNVPVGFSAHGLPMGMQIIGKRGSDPEILKLGEVFHQATMWPQKHAPIL
ncbi:MAG: amidase [Pseudomonadota bacterium]